MPAANISAVAKPSSRLRELGLVLPSGTRPRRLRYAQRANRHTGHSRNGI
jgi:hypothetical protein